MSKGTSISQSNAACTTRLTAIMLALGTMMSAAALADSTVKGGIDHKRHPRHPRTALTCDDSMKSAFKPDANTTVTLVKAFQAGDPLLLSGTPTPTTPIASKDVCMVELQCRARQPGPGRGPVDVCGHRHGDLATRTGELE